ncbi:MAG: S8 family serine peptidase [Candidatus Omnitrophica bacterium]|nr:S8 family serine peptidase [Candidatus Omnitrophota bacterium]
MLQIKEDVLKVQKRLCLQRAGVCTDCGRDCWNPEKMNKAKAVVALPTREGFVREALRSPRAAHVIRQWAQDGRLWVIFPELAMLQVTASGTSPANAGMTALEHTLQGLDKMQAILRNERAVFNKGAGAEISEANFKLLHEAATRAVAAHGREMYYLFGLLRGFPAALPLFQRLFPDMTQEAVAKLEDPPQARMRDPSEPTDETVYIHMMRAIPVQAITEEEKEQLKMLVRRIDPARLPDAVRGQVLSILQANHNGDLAPPQTFKAVVLLPCLFGYALRGEHVIVLSPELFQPAFESELLKTYVHECGHLAGLIESQCRQLESLDLTRRVSVAREVSDEVFLSRIGIVAVPANTLEQKKANMKPVVLGAYQRRNRVFLLTMLTGLIVPTTLAIFYAPDFYTIFDHLRFVLCDLLALAALAVVWKPGAVKVLSRAWRATLIATGIAAAVLMARPFFVDDTRPVTMFIVDSQEQIVKADIGNIFKDLTHQEVVRQLAHGRIAPDRTYVLSVNDFTYRIYPDDYCKALRQILKYMDKNPTDKVVVNISLGSTETNIVEQILIQALCEKGAVVVAAAGNDAGAPVSFPAAYERVIAVGAMENGHLASYSSRGPRLDVLEEGGFSAFRQVSTGISSYGQAINIGGTSFASPRVAAIAADILKYAHVNVDVRRVLKRESSSEYSTERMRIFAPEAQEVGRFDAISRVAQERIVYEWAQIVAMIGIIFLGWRADVLFFSEKLAGFSKKQVRAFKRGTLWGILGTLTFSGAAFFSGDVYGALPFILQKAMYDLSGIVITYIFTFGLFRTMPGFLGAAFLWARGRSVIAGILHRRRFEYLEEIAAGWETLDLETQEAVYQALLVSMDKKYAKLVMAHFNSGWKVKETGALAMAYMIRTALLEELIGDAMRHGWSGSQEVFLNAAIEQCPVRVRAAFFVKALEYLAQESSMAPKTSGVLNSIEARKKDLIARGLSFEIPADAGASTVALPMPASATPVPGDTAYPFYSAQATRACGAAAVRMALAQFGRKVSEQDLGQALGTDPLTGTAFERIMAYFRAHGFEVDPAEPAAGKNGYQELWSALQDGHMVIARLDLSALYPDAGLSGVDAAHFVMVPEMRGGNVLVHDPAQTSGYYISAANFFQATAFSFWIAVRPHAYIPTQDELRRMITAFRAGDPAVQSRMIRRFDRFLISIAASVYPCCSEFLGFDDLMQYGRTALVNALRKETLDMANPGVLGCLALRVRGGMYDGIRTEMPVSRKNAGKLKRILQAIPQEELVDPDFSAIAGKTGLSRSQVARTLESWAVQNALSLDQPAAGNDTEPAGTLADTVESLDPALYRRDVQEQVDLLLHGTDKVPGLVARIQASRARSVTLAAYFDLVVLPVLLGKKLEFETQAAIAQKLGVSPSMITIIQRQVVTMIQSMMKSLSLESWHFRRLIEYGVVPADSEEGDLNDYRRGAFTGCNEESRKAFDKLVKAGKIPVAAIPGFFEVRFVPNHDWLTSVLGALGLKKQEAVFRFVTFDPALIARDVREQQLSGLQDFSITSSDLTPENECVIYISRQALARMGVLFPAEAAADLKLALLGICWHEFVELNGASHETAVEVQNKICEKSPVVRDKLASLQYAEYQAQVVASNDVPAYAIGSAMRIDRAPFERELVENILALRHADQVTWFVRTECVHVPKALTEALEQVTKALVDGVFYAKNNIRPLDIFAAIPGAEILKEWCLLVDEKKLVRKHGLTQGSVYDMFVRALDPKENLLIASETRGDAAKVFEHANHRIEVAHERILGAFLRHITDMDDRGKYEIFVNNFLEQAMSESQGRRFWAETVAMNAMTRCDQEEAVSLTGRVMTSAMPWIAAS